MWAQMALILSPKNIFWSFWAFLGRFGHFKKRPKKPKMTGNLASLHAFFAIVKTIFSRLSQFFAQPAQMSAMATGLLQKVASF